MFFCDLVEWGQAYGRVQARVQSQGRAAAEIGGKSGKKRVDEQEARKRESKVIKQGERRKERPWPPATRGSVPYNMHTHTHKTHQMVKRKMPQRRMRDRGAADG
jgi:hypothetical protein